MLTAEQNELLTQTGPGTPAGALLRSYWQPVALSEELLPGGAPVPVRVMGEDLVLFRESYADGEPYADGRAALRAEAAAKRAESDGAGAHPAGRRLEDASGRRPLPAADA